MTSSPDHDLLEAFPIPEDCIALPPTELARSRRASVVEALQLAIQERDPSLPLGPQTALQDDDRLLVLNRFGLQLSIGDLPLLREIASVAGYCRDYTSAW